MRVHRHITTRSGGVSVGPYSSLNLGDHVGDDPVAVAENRRLLAKRIGLPPGRLVWLNQTHSTNVVLVEGPTSATLPDTDAVVTAVADLALVVMTADCVPVLLSDPHAGVIAVAHAGRVGARNGIVLRTLEVMKSVGAQPDRIEAYLGPAAGGAEYEVPPAMQADVERHLPGSSSITSHGTTGLDLRAGIALQLRNNAVTRIETDPRCTITDPELFSHRRDDPTGRLASVMWMSL